MKKLLKAILVSFSLSSFACSAETAPKAEPVPETKRVCIKVWDAAKKQEVEKCRTIKIHEKKEGTTVPAK